MWKCGCCLDDAWKEKSKSNKRTFFPWEKKKDFRNLRGNPKGSWISRDESCCSDGGGRQKANCAAQRAHLTTLQTLSVPCRNFYEQGIYCSEKEEVKPGNNETLVYCWLFVALSTVWKHKQSNGPNPQANWTLLKKKKDKNIQRGQHLTKQSA